MAEMLNTDGDPPPASPPRGRPKLMLKKRDPAAAARLAQTRSRGSNPFGDAKPREEVLTSKGVDVKAMDRKTELKAQAAHRLTRQQREEADALAAEVKNAENALQEANEKELSLITEQTQAFQKDMNGRIVKAIMKGEAAAKRVAERAQANLKGMKKGMLVEISERVEATADKLFATIQGDHQKIADNYLSLKAYAVTASGKLNDYVTKGKGKNLSSLGDLMSTIGSTANIPTEKAEGLGFGGDTIPAIFSNEKISVLKKNKDGKIVEGKVSKINGLVNEYTANTNAVRARWPMGLGKYLLSKLEESMLEKGVLQVDKVSEKSGNFVFLNGHAVGLSNKLNDFESLAVRMTAYEQTLAKLTAALSGKHKPTPPKKKPLYVPAPEWSGA